MKLKRGQARYKIPPHSQILSVVVNGDHKFNTSFVDKMVCIVDQIEQDGVFGFPKYVCISKIKDWATFYPIPAHSYSVTIRYVPPIEEF